MWLVEEAQSKKQNLPPLPLSLFVSKASISLFSLMLGLVGPTPQFLVVPLLHRSCPWFPLWNTITRGFHWEREDESWLEELFKENYENYVSYSFFHPNLMCGTVFAFWQRGFNPWHSHAFLFYSFLLIWTSNFQFQNFAHLSILWSKLAFFNLHPRHSKFPNVFRWASSQPSGRINIKLEIQTFSKK